jgi:hypothetical protein
MRIRNQKDFLAGLLFIAFGAAAVIEAGGYPMGSTMRMGPGYFPVVLGAFLIGLGAAISGLNVASKEDRPLGRIGLRPLVLITVSLLTCAFLLKQFGLVPAIISTVWVSCIGGYEFRFYETLMLAVGLAVACVLIFYIGLGLPFTLWRW